MALAPLTPRDRLQRLAGLASKALRYWWLVGGFMIVGGVLAFAFAVTRPKRFDSSAVLFYQEQIQSSILSNRQEEVQRNLGDRFRELLLARAQLQQIIDDPKIDPLPPGVDPELGVDRLRQAIKFEARGGNNFRITYTDSDPDRAQAVAARLTKLLQDKDKSLRDEQAQLTVSFATQQKDEAAGELRKREQGLAEFLAKHPEFAQDAAQVNTEGASIRAIRNQSKTPVQTGNPRLYALERERQRIQARLDAPPDAPPIKVASPATPEKLAAEAAVADAQREVAAAKRDLDDALAKYTERHPTVINAQERYAAAQQRLRHAQDTVPPDIETEVAPATPADRTKLTNELAQINQAIANEEHSDVGRGSAAATAAATAATDSTNWVVELETQHADLRRQLAEQRERVGSLADSVFRAQLDASQKIAESGGRLSIVDPAFRPMRPTGPGKTIFLLAGVMVFAAMGGAIAIGLAIIDDRMYRRDDLEIVGVPVLAVVPPLEAPRRLRAGKQAS